MARQTGLLLTTANRFVSVHRNIFQTDRHVMKIRLPHLIYTALFFTITGCAGGQQKHPTAYHYQMGLSFLGERNYTGALIELTEAARLDPENPDILYNLGMAYMGKNRPDLAEQPLLKTIEIKPNNSSARNDLGVAYLDLKKWDKAIIQFKIVKNDIFFEHNESTSINLALAYLGKGENQLAMDELHYVLRANSRRIEARLSLGRVYFAMGKTEQAINEYKRALEIYQDYGDAHFHLGIAYLKQQQIDAARTEFNEVIRIKPNSESGRAAQGYLELLK